jgi:hypothetical protein
LQQTLEKTNKFNIKTHHIFIDFKATNDTITRNKIYVIIAELDFPTKRIRLTKATLKTIKCCVKIQNDCSGPFETQQELIQRDVLSTLLFNVVFEAIVRRTKLHTTGTIFKKQAQLLAYSDDINIVGRSLEAVWDA